MNDQQALLEARGIEKTFFQGEVALPILKGLDFRIAEGEAACIVGASGAGKSTLLQILGTLDKPTSGELYYRGENLLAKRSDQLARFRNNSIGFVFQFHHLLGEFTALENVMMPVRLGGGSAKLARLRAEELLSEMGLSDRKTHYPSQLSGGEKQRVAIARALAQRPEVLMADEPTGNLDAENGKMIQDLFFDLKDRFGLTLVVVTHDSDFASRFPRVQHLKDGRWL